jgi:enoyl-CoA hydratase/carnithine racemase
MRRESTVNIARVSVAAAEVTMSSQSGIRVERTPGSPRAILWLEREPVNSMTLDFWRALSNAFDALERDETV